jgi:hypothetical protein
MDGSSAEREFEYFGTWADVPPSLQPIKGPLRETMFPPGPGAAAADRYLYYRGPEGVYRESRGGPSSSNDLPPPTPRMLSAELRRYSGYNHCCFFVLPSSLYTRYVYNILSSQENLFTLFSLGWVVEVNAALTLGARGA